MLSLRLLGTLLSLSMSFNVAATTIGGNTSGGGGPDTVDTGALRLLVEGGGLKRAMIHYLETLPVGRIEDGIVRTKLTEMMASDALLSDVQTSRYVPATPGSPCRDAYNHDVPASTQVGSRGSDICFDISKLVPYYRHLNNEDAMVKLASLAFHEHTHHFQIYSKQNIQRNEDEANRIGGYISITAKFEQLPVLRWTAPGSSFQDMREMETLWAEVKAREMELMAPSEQDYAAYPGFRGQADRGIVRLFPRENYDGKMATPGGGSVYDFATLDHSYDNGTDIKLEQGVLQMGLAGCDFGFMTKIDHAPLAQIDETNPAARFLNDFIVAKGEPAIRVQQSSALYGPTSANGYTYTSRVSKFSPGDTFIGRSIVFDEHDIMVAFQVIRVDENGIYSLAWKKIKTFPTSSCR